MRRLVRGRDIARQTLQVALHACGRALELRKVLFGQPLEPERTGLVAKFFGHCLLLAWLPRSAYEKSSLLVMPWQMMASTLRHPGAGRDLLRDRHRPSPV
jgi:hypothetical protein